MSSINLIQDKMNLTYNNLSLISDNLANINTPDYKRKYIDIHGSFNSILDTKLKKTRDKHIDFSLSSDGGINEVEAYMRTDGNGVDIDAEIVELNKNKLYHNSLIRLMNNDINNLRNIITSK
ncbi:flagellar basal body rod protein FlgB [Clostridium perfringens]